MTNKTLRCAIYTRKSSEEGLEQDFNSLHAQREACASYIASQKHEGWQMIKTHYDDGGFSGGNMERPALKQLLADIAMGKIDIIVVYKVDRLSRSLHDFAKMVELFDKHSVSFVSVTQQFNTTTSMGRLTLNVLLSFAQFEREVTGERIRDKIAASKKKGMWMGGAVPLGYKVEDRKLLPEPAEAATAHHIFTRYLETGCIRLLMQALKSEGIRSRKGQILSHGALYGMLSNPIYIGKICHKSAVHDGLHEGIIPQELWNAVQQHMANNRIGTKTRARRTDACPLTNKLFDTSGARLIPVHALKKGRRYRYYISESLKNATRSESPDGWRLPGQEIEQVVTQAAVKMLREADAITTAMQNACIAGHHIPAILAAAKKISADTSDIIEHFVQRVELRPDGIRITITLASLLPAGTMQASPTTDYPAQKAHADDGIAEYVATSTAHRGSPTITRDIPMQMKRRGAEIRLVVGGDTTPTHIDSTLIKNIARARKWVEDLIGGNAKSLTDIATFEGIDLGDVSRLLHLAFLAPAVVEAIVAGKQPAHLCNQKIVRGGALPISWKEQHPLLGFC